MVDASCGQFRGDVIRLKAPHEAVQILFGEPPLERLRDLLIVAFKAQDPLFELANGGKVVRRQHFAPQDREVDFYLVEPAGVYRRVHQHEVVPAPLEPVDARLSPVRGAA